MSDIEQSKIELLRQLALSESREQDRRKTKPSPSAQALLLCRLLEEYRREKDFEIGDLVCWEDGLRNKTEPAYGYPAIVVELLDEPVIADKERSGTPYFRELLDMKVGFIDEDGDFTILHVDRRRFKSWTTKNAEI